MFGVRGKVVEEVGIIGGCIAVQCVYAAYSVFLSYLMSLGLNPQTFIIFTTSMTSIVLSPFSFHFERNLWPKRRCLKLLMQLILVSFGEVTLFRSLFLTGIKLTTSPALGTAMANLAPALIFFIAATFGLEKFQAKCLYNKIKIFGTLLCVIGAVTMAIMQSATKDPIVKETRMVNLPLNVSSYMLDPEKIMGCIYLIVAVLALSASAVLQAWTLGDLPAPLSFTTITSLFGAIMTAILELIVNGKIDSGRSIFGVPNLICLFLLGGIVSGATLSFNVWAMKKRGPVLVFMFNPVATIVSAILSYIILGQQISLGSVVGMLLVFGGLYFFLWAKGKEDSLIANGCIIQSGGLDVEKPLLY